MQKPHLGILLKPASYDCNLACEHCYYRDVRDLYPGAARPRMSTEVFEAVCRGYRALEPANINIGWQGGEPTLMGLDFFEKVIAIETKNARPGDCWGNSLQTNGLLLNDDWCRFLARHHFLIGLSIDGPPPLNALRRFPDGSGTYREVMNALSLLKRHKCEHNILFVISRINCNRPEELFRFLVENDLHYSQFIPCTEPDAVGDGLSRHSITPEQYAQFQMKLFDAWVENDDPSFYLRHIDNWLHLFFGLPPEMCEYRSDCSNLMTVEWNGDVYPCDFFVRKRYLMGNVLTESMENMLRSRAWKEFVSRAEKLPALCSGCRWLNACHGGCYRQRGKLGLEDGDKPYFCEANSRIFEHVFGVLDELKKKNIKPTLHGFLKDIEKQQTRRMQPRSTPSPPPRPRRGATDGGARSVRAKPGRNDPCPCGSDRKFKTCCAGKIPV